MKECVWVCGRDLGSYLDGQTCIQETERERERGGGKIDREIESYKNRHMRTREGTRKKERNVDTCRRERRIIFACSFFLQLDGAIKMRVIFLIIIIIMRCRYFLNLLFDRNLLFRFLKYAVSGRGQLVERSPLTPEVRSSNPVMGNLTLLKRQR